MRGRSGSGALAIARWIAGACSGTVADSAVSHRGEELKRIKSKMKSTITIKTSPEPCGLLSPAPDLIRNLNLH